MTESTAATEGPDWSSRADAWVEHWPRLAEPARRAVSDAAGVGPGVRVLDVGCGTGEFCALAAERGASVCGIDAGEGMVAHARRRLPGADLRVGPMESLPWDDDAFDVVTAFNALQFAASFEAAVAEAARVTRPGGLLAVCSWGAPGDLAGVYAALSPSGDEDERPPPPALEDRVGLPVVAAADVDVPYESPDLATLTRAIVEGAGFEATRAAVESAAAPYRRPDGSYRFESTFRYVIARV
jgi:SAM-dependent methyltransferase